MPDAKRSQRMGMTSFFWSSNNHFSFYVLLLLFELPLAVSFVLSVCSSLINRFPPWAPPCYWPIYSRLKTSHAGPFEQMVSKSFTLLSCVLDGRVQAPEALLIKACPDQQWTLISLLSSHKLHLKQTNPLLKFLSLGKSFEHTVKITQKLSISKEYSSAVRGSDGETLCFRFQEKEPPKKRAWSTKPWCRELQGKNPQRKTPM